MLIYRVEVHCAFGAHTFGVLTVSLLGDCFVAFQTVAIKCGPRPPFAVWNFDDGKDGVTLYDIVF